MEVEILHETTRIGNFGGCPVHWKAVEVSAAPLYAAKNQQVRPSSATDVYQHMPILRPHAARFHERRISSMTLTSAHLYGNVYIPVGVARALADSSDFGLLGKQSSQKWEIPCLGRRCKIWRR